MNELVVTSYAIDTLVDLCVNGTDEKVRLCAAVTLLREASLQGHPGASLPASDDDQGSQHG